jgi:hypothetical protein
VVPSVVHADGRRVDVPHRAHLAAGGGRPAVVDATEASLAPGATEEPAFVPVTVAVAVPGSGTGARHQTDANQEVRTDAPGKTRRLPLGTLIGARSGDKGGNANVGLWARTDGAWAWLEGYLTLDRFRQLLPEADNLEVDRHVFANLRAVNFVVVGLLGEGVASSTRPDPQAKGLGEYLRSKLVDIPNDLLDAG